MRTFLITLLVLLTGCSTTVPVVAKFPEAPSSIGECGELLKLNNNSKLSDVAETVSQNYNTYYECSIKNSAWIEWYKTQKKIFESVK